MSAAAEQAFVLPRLRRHISYPTFAALLIDVFALELALFCAVILRFVLSFGDRATLVTSQYTGLATAVLIVPVAYHFMGLYPGYGIGAVQRLRCRLYPTFIIFAALLAWDYAFQGGRWSRGVLISTMIFSLTFPSLLEFLFRSWLSRLGVIGVPAVVLGAGAIATQVVKKLKRPSLGLAPIAILDDDRRKWGEYIDGIPVVGPISSISNFQRQAKLVVIAMPEIHRDLLVNLVQHLAFPKIIVVPDLIGLQTLWTTTKDLDGVLGLELQKNLLITENRILKLILEYLIAIPLFLFSLPVLAICAVWIKHISPGPAFFWQEREGKGGKPIKIWKLRTMYPNAEALLAGYLRAYPEQKAAWMRHYKLKKDPRILPKIGTTLRRLSLDELPQLWNVLRGEMSLVGPRPFPYYHLDRFPSTFRALRRSVAPGLTGLWQVSDRSDGDLDVQEALDTYYIQNWSPWLDFYILLRTVRTVLVPRGAY
jgi:Undecaprenyl-phosphate galactose phosphotransferase WbaP